MPQRTSSGYKPTPLDVARRPETNPAEPNEDTPVTCPTCGQKAVLGDIRADERGTLIAHPGRHWACRVEPGVGVVA